LFAVPDDDLSGVDLKGHHSKRRSGSRSQRRKNNKDNAKTANRAPITIKRDSDRLRSDRRSRSKSRSQAIPQREKAKEESSSVIPRNSNTSTYSSGATSSAATPPPALVSEENDNNSSTKNNDSKPVSEETYSKTTEPASETTTTTTTTATPSDSVTTPTKDHGANTADDDNNPCTPEQDATILFKEAMTPDEILQDASNPLWKDMTLREQKILERLTKSNLTVNQLVIKPKCIEWNNFLENATLLDEIRKDVVRTHPDLYFFLEPENNLGNRRYAALERILFVWAKLNKGVREKHMVFLIHTVISTRWILPFLCRLLPVLLIPLFSFYDML
jgi:hypothetical protein